MGLYGEEPITVSYDSVKFGGRRLSRSGDMFFICHVISKDLVIKGSCDFMGGIPCGKSSPCQVWCP